MKTPYFVKHKNELKPRIIVNLDPNEHKIAEVVLAKNELLLVKTSSQALELMKEFGDPMSCEIQTIDEDDKERLY